MVDFLRTWVQRFLFFSHASTHFMSSFETTTDYRCPTVVPDYTQSRVTRLDGMFLVNHPGTRFEQVQTESPQKLLKELGAFNSALLIRLLTHSSSSSLRLLHAYMSLNGKSVSTNCGIHLLSHHQVRFKSHRIDHISSLLYVNTLIHFE